VYFNLECVCSFFLFGSIWDGLDEGVFYIFVCCEVFRLCAGYLSHLSMAVAECIIVGVITDRRATIISTIQYDPFDQNHLIYVFVKCSLRHGLRWKYNHNPF
jgi:uncharacterized membrane protein (DUF373 family)